MCANFGSRPAGPLASDRFHKIEGMQILAVAQPVHLNQTRTPVKMKGVQILAVAPAGPLASDLYTP